MPDAIPIPPEPPRRTLGKSIGAFVLAALSVVYLLNFDAGIFEFIPDNIPVIGNLDEVAATILLLNCLAYFGLDFRHLASGLGKREKNITPPDKMPR